MLYKPYTVVLFGHRQLANALQLEQQLEGIVRDWLRTHAQVNFLLGRNGEFDLLAASVIRRVRRDFGERSAHLTLLLPYPTSEYRDNGAEFHRYSDEVAIFAALPSTPAKACIPLHNRAISTRMTRSSAALTTPSAHMTQRCTPRRTGDPCSMPEV